jgi:hypothetical protein
VEVKSFSEIVPDKKSFDVDERVALSELVDKEFIVKNYELFPSKFEGTDEFSARAFGDKAPEIPSKYNSFIKTGPGHRRVKHTSLLVDFISWISSHYRPGIHGKLRDKE